MAANVMVAPPRKGAASDYVTGLMALVKARNPNEPEFHQAVLEVVGSLVPVLDRHPEYRAARLLERITEPERVLMFRVPWMDDRGEIRVNRGFRIEMSSAIGPDSRRRAFCASRRMYWLHAAARPFVASVKLYGVQSTFASRRFGPRRPGLVTVSSYTGISRISVCVRSMKHSSRRV